MMAVYLLCVITLLYCSLLTKTCFISWHPNRLCSVVTACKYSICCKCASTHLFVHFPFLCMYQFGRSLRWAEANYKPMSPHYIIKQMRMTQMLFQQRHNWWPCFYDRLLSNWLWQQSTVCDGGGCTVEILLCTHYPSKRFIGAVLQLFPETDVVMAHNAFWQDALFPVVQQHRGHNTLAYSWSPTRAQVDLTTLPFWMKEVFYWVINIMRCPFHSAWAASAEYLEDWKVSVGQICS